MTAGADTGSLRRRNLSTVLSLVHRGGAASRAELTRATGLNRSTVGDLVAELVRLELLREQSSSPTGVAGRPSPVSAADPRVVAVAANPEVDGLAVAVVGLDGVVRMREWRPFDHPPSVPQAVDALGQLTDSLLSLLPGHRVAGCGIALPGLVRAADGQVVWAPHLGWESVALADVVQERLALPVRVGNDADLGCLAEHVLGVGRGVDDLVYLNGGASGIGGGIIVDGRPLGGATGFAGEWGHTVLQAGDVPAEAEALINRARLAAALELPTVSDAELHAAVLTAGGGPAAAEVRAQAEYLGALVANVINVLNPSLVLLGGFLAALHEAEPAAVAAALHQSALTAARAQTRIVPASLGADLLLIGAAELAFSALLADPANATLAPAGRLPP